MVIHSLTNPKSQINAYLEPLIEELMNLWHVGVLTHDNAMNQIFMMHVALMWTMNDLPAYEMVSGWSTAGVMGYLVFMDYTRAFHMQHEFSIAVQVPLTLPSSYGSEHKWTKKNVFWELEY
ncbi:UNVERIFIED_CONTAM: hypothetical protein Sradi_0479600 [Sesamum radiatum]|uniref:Uncharacterized protein n=1 Tax=Sesamum radiatum TaxID=300843 RepID=A0AAW2WBV6_SESRA